MNTQAIRAEALGLADRVAQPLGLAVVDVTYTHEAGRRVVRVVLHHPKGVSLEHLESFSRAYGAALDQQGVIPENYSLETQSPGLNRNLRSDREFDIFKGKAVAVRTYEPFDGTRGFVGELRGLQDGRVVVVQADGRVWRLPRASVASVRLQDEDESS